jgi:hypothetical protein
LTVVPSDFHYGDSETREQNDDAESRQQKEMANRLTSSYGAIQSNFRMKPW